MEAHIKSDNIELIIVTGLCGAGKTTALRSFEDLGFFCIDNIPPMLILTFISLYQEVSTKAPGVAVVCDVRSGDLFNDFQNAIEQLRNLGVNFRILFLDADTDVVVRRFQENRRIPPLVIPGRSFAEAIELERTKNLLIREYADAIFDTTQMSASQLRDAVIPLFTGISTTSAITITLISFGYKFGLPLDADFVFDSRFLPNPFYEAELKDLTGEEDRVKDFVLQSSLARDFVENIYKLINSTIPYFSSVHKMSLNVGVGCTGGKHRSVVIVNELSSRFQKIEIKSNIIHRDMNKL